MYIHCISKELCNFKNICLSYLQFQGAEFELHKSIIVIIEGLQWSMIRPNRHSMGFSLNVP